MSLLEKMRKNASLKSELDQTYLGLRNQALKIKPYDLHLDVTSNDQVYAAIVDIPINDKIATLCCVFDGTVSLYYCNGGGLLGLGQRYDTVRKSSGSLLISAGQTIPFLQYAYDVSVVRDGKAHVFLLVRDGIFQETIDMNHIDTEEKHKKFLNFLIQNVINSIRVSQNDL